MTSIPDPEGDVADTRVDGAQYSIPPHPPGRSMWSSSIKLWAWLFGLESSVSDGISCGATGTPVWSTHVSRAGMLW
jgi:hypothetical protein